MNQPGSDLLQADPCPDFSCPPSLPACLPFIWNRILFPGVAPQIAPLRWTSVLILVLLPGLFLYPCLSFRLFEPDEGRYAEIPREMLLRGDWVVPYLQGEPYLDKPPLLYWLVMAGYTLLGVHDWSARLIPALAVHGCVLVTYLLGRRSLGERAAFWGAVSLGLAPGFLNMGRLLVLDGLLAFWVTLSLFAGFEALRGPRLRWGAWIVASGACGLGILTKGPVALLLLVPPLWAYRRLNGSSWRLGRRAIVAFAAVILVLILPWYGAMCVRMPAFAGYFLWEHNIVRFLAPFDHLRPIWFYGPVVLIGLLPGSLLVLGFVRFLLSAQAGIARRRCAELGFMVLSGGWCLCFFSLSGCKLPTYVLPGFPPLALAFGAYLADSRWCRSRWLVPIGGLTVVVLAVAHYAAIPWYADFHSPLSRPVQLQQYCADRATPVVCYPRNCDSVSFYMGRDDLRTYRSKQTPLLLEFLQDHPRTVVLFTHRHSLDTLRQVLPVHLRLADITPLSSSWRGGNKPELCYMAVVERRGQ